MTADDRPADRPRCTALTKNGDQCSRRAQPGELTCKAHAPNARPQGRPSKLTPELKDALAELLGLGNFREQAVQAVGVPKSTFYGWLERGEADTEAGKATIYSDLLDAVSRAEAAAEITAVQYLRRWMLTDLRAVTYYLERRHPSRWRRRESVELEGDLTFKPTERVAPEGDDQRRKVAELLAGTGLLDRELETATAAAAKTSKAKPRKRTPPKKGPRR